MLTKIVGTFGEVQVQVWKKFEMFILLFLSWLYYVGMVFGKDKKMLRLEIVCKSISTMFERVLTLNVKDIDVQNFNMFKFSYKIWYKYLHLKINIQRKYILYKVEYINHLLYEVIYVYVYQTLVFILGVHILYPWWCT